MSNKQFQKKSNTDNDDLNDALANLNISKEKASFKNTECTYNTESQIKSNDNKEHDVTNDLKSFKVGLAYDSSMLLHEHPIRHVECPARIEKTWNILKMTGIVDRCELIPSRIASEDELILVHSQKHIDNLKNNTLPLAELAAGDLFWNKHSYNSAIKAVGNVVETSERIINGEIDCGFALVRPPGHHAVKGKPMGFCFYNNVAIAASKALKNESINKVLILDWDVHHGNGIQDIFYSNPNVMYISIHRWEDDFYYPGTGDVSEIGYGDGRGYNINVPIKNPEFNDIQCLAVFEILIEPLVKEFDPDFIIVSAGFDAASNDLVGDCDLSPLLFGHLTEKLLHLSKGKLMLALEGGYNVQQLGQSILNCMKALLRDDLDKLDMSLGADLNLYNLFLLISENIQETWPFFTISFIENELEKFHKKYNLKRYGDIEDILKGIYAISF